TTYIRVDEKSRAARSLRSLGGAASASPPAGGGGPFFSRALGRRCRLNGFDSPAPSGYWRIHVVAYPFGPRWLPSALPTLPRRSPAVRPRLGLRDQARWLSHDGPARRSRCPAAHPQRARLVAKISTDLRGRRRAQGALVPDRRRGGGL